MEQNHYRRRNSPPSIPSTQGFSSPSVPAGVHIFNPATSHPQPAAHTVPSSFPLPGAGGHGGFQNAAPIGPGPYAPQGNDFFSDIGKSLPPGIGDSAFAQMGLAYGANFLGQGQNYVQSHYGRTFSTVKYYFNVNNSYVINKLKLLLFPLRHKFWKRTIRQGPGGEPQYAPPREDINAPDLYIPSMAFVTYVLLVGYVMGTTSQFTPQVLGNTASRGLTFLAFEVLLVKCGFYLLNAVTVPWLDVVAYCAYKFVGVVLTTLFGFAFGPTVFYGLFVVTSLSVAMFMVKTLRLVFPEGGLGNHKNKPKYFLLFVAALQFLMNFYLSVLV